MRVTLGNPEGGSFTGNFEKRTKEGSRNGVSLSLSFSMGARVTSRKRSFTGDRERYVKEGSGNGLISP